VRKQTNTRETSNKQARKERKIIMISSRKEKLYEERKRDTKPRKNES
jgi:hypothetical protein